MYFILILYNRKYFILILYNRKYFIQEMKTKQVFSYACTHQCTDTYYEITVSYRPVLSVYFLVPEISTATEASQFI